MTLLTALHHVTRYDYDRPIMLGPQTIRLRPAPHARALVESYSLQVTPKPHFLNWQQDPFGNHLARVVFPEPTRFLQVAVDLVTDIRVFNPFDFFLEDTAEHIPFVYDASTAEELIPYLEIKERGPLLSAFLSDVPRTKTPTIDFLVALNQRVHHHLAYGIRLEPGVQSCEETMDKRSGSCRDMAWLLCQMLRHLGLASRFASGYLIQLKADVAALDGPDGPKEDFTDLHAWCEVYLPGAGWVGLDPTSGLFAGEGHIPLCCTPNPSSAAPISGVLDPCESTLHHSMTVTRIHEDHRVSKPYPPLLWQAIDDLGQKVDQDLIAGDVRLTMGGEPTFVSLDERDHPAWETAALGGQKKALAYTLFQPLCPAGSVQQFSHGKWYPGEILPRWSMASYGRKDGLPIWKNRARLADPEKSEGHTPEMAKAFLQDLVKVLGVSGDGILPAFEDIPYALWKEGTLPLDGDIRHDDPFEAAERKRLQRLFEKTYNSPAGYVLPLFYSMAQGGWTSALWAFRRDRLVLLTGDSPVGLRLPLSSLPHEPPVELLPERSPEDQRDPLPSFEDLSPAKSEAPRWDSTVRTALCAEVRGGTLHLFLPPLSYAEHALALLAAIERVAEAKNVAVVLEGYPLPPDLRLQHFSVTPDPGVIEVNIQPAHSWDDLKTITEGVYETARQCRLTADKFLLDGRRVGTGGGNHIVTGAATPQDSPFLRRPDLLKSLLTFWQNHPSLSYLFSGQFIGPTSQAPRVDEARLDSLYELDIALSHIPSKGAGDMPHWLLDRMLRNLLVDLTGNTHRSEFCIDKLYSPDSQRGRLGLLEMRGFEMTPHPQMNLLQALLIRACIAAFWHKPYQAPLVAWGTRLHDQFMLPHCVWQDFTDVLGTLKHHGYTFDPAWFLPFLDFRFPLYGTVQVGDVRLELRMALEPWPVMGEDSSFGGGTSRGVDSSLERLQVAAHGLIPGRHIVTCNRYPLPLVATEAMDTFVAGVRYKAWAPASSLHPTIPIHTPLVFDVVDTRYSRSLGGCTYHVMHPGGRNYERLPINENEAEGRRLSRFEKSGHTTGAFVPKPALHHPAFPCTLDLRWG